MARGSVPASDRVPLDSFRQGVHPVGGHAIGHARREPGTDPDITMDGKWKRADLSGARFEKRPGDDWVVDVFLISEGETYPVTVFGAADKEAAVADALSTFGDRADCRVDAVERI